MTKVLLAPKLVVPVVVAIAFTSTNVFLSVSVSGAVRGSKVVVCDIIGLLVGSDPAEFATVNKITAVAVTGSVGLTPEM